MAPRQNKIALVNRFASVSIEAKRLVAAKDVTAKRTVVL